MAGLLQRSPQARLSGVQATALLGSQSATPTPRYGGDTDTGPVATVAPPRRRWLWPVAAVLALAVGLGAGYLLPRQGERDVPVLSYGDGGDLPTFDVSSTTCLQGQLVAGRQFPSSSTVSCDTPHDVEIFETLDPFGTQRAMAYPGREQLSGYASAACGLVFDSAVITAAGKDRLQVAALVPSDASFAKRASPTSSFTDRDVICLLRAADGTQLTGTRISKAAG
jgi:hypothetical protein